MVDVLRQVVQNLRANKLRSVLTMFGIAWGVISVVILQATGEGFQRGNQHVLEEQHAVLLVEHHQRMPPATEPARYRLTREDLQALGIHRYRKSQHTFRVIAFGKRGR